METMSTRDTLSRDAVDRPDIPFFDHSYDGYLVVVEGLGGVGKTTLLGQLDERLTARGVAVVRERHPTPEALQLPLFRRYMYEPDQRPYIEYRALLAALLSDRLQHAAAVVRPALARGDCVLMDRYIYTMLAIMRARGYEEAWLVSACNLFPRPDVAVLLDAPLHTAIERIAARTGQRESYVEEELYLRTQEEYRWFAHRGALTVLRSDRADPGDLAEEVCKLLECRERERTAGDFSTKRRHRSASICSSPT